MTTKTLPTKAEREVLDRKLARKPLTLDQGAAELRDVALLTRDHLKAFVAAGRLALYRMSGKRYIQRAELARFRSWLEARIADDPDWLEQETQRVRGKAGNVRRVVSGTGAPPVRVVPLTISGAITPRKVVVASSVKPPKVATLTDAPRPALPRVVERGRR